MSLHGYRLVAGGVVVWLAVLYLIFHNGSWVFDDNFILEFARQHGFSLTWLRTPLYQHWGAGTNAAFSLLLALFPIDYRWGLFIALVALGAMIWLFDRTFARVTLTPQARVAATVWFACSILWTGPLQWWTFSVQTFPNLFFDLLCLYGFLRYQSDRSWRWGVISAAAIAAGLLFYEKPAFMLLYLGLAEILLVGHGRRPTAIAVDFWRDRSFWAPSILVVALWYLEYRSTGAYPAALHITLGQYASYFRIFWAHALVPAAFGLTVPSAHLTTWQSVGVIGGQLAVIGLVVATVVRRRGAWRAWAFLAIIVVVSGALVARSRVALFGVSIGDDLRYIMDFTWLLPLTVCAALHGGELLPRDVRLADERGGDRRRRSVGLGIGAVLLAAYVAISLITSVRLERAWPAHQARDWYQNVRSSTSRLRSLSVEPVIGDEDVPPSIVGAWEDPYSRLSSMLPVYSRNVRVDGPLTGPLVAFDQRGIAHFATIQPVQQGFVSVLVRSGRLHLAGLTPTHGSCYRAAPTGGVLAARLNRTSALSGVDTLYLLLDYHSNVAMSAQLYGDFGTGLLPISRITLAPSASSTIAWLGLGRIVSYQINVVPGALLCLNRLAIVRLRPGARL